MRRAGAGFLIGYARHLLRPSGAFSVVSRFGELGSRLLAVQLGSDWWPYRRPARRRRSSSAFRSCMAIRSVLGKKRFLFLSASLIVLAALRPVLPATALAADDVLPGRPAMRSTAAVEDSGDPLEPINRAIFAGNEFLQSLVLRPLSDFYALVLPEPARNGVRNVMDNLHTPVVLANDLLQGKPRRAGETAGRFLINSTVGIGGLFDAAKEMGVEGHNEDLGQTLAVWGIPDGSYLVLPILGPSNPRDAVGLFGDSYLDPATYWADNTDNEAALWGRRGLRAVDSYSRVAGDLRKLRETSIDYYAVVRSIYRQRRAAEIDDDVSGATPLPEVRYDLNARYGDE
jgi:phospholipid-binding lipoprotein MlaA